MQYCLVILSFFCTVTIQANEKNIYFNTYSKVGAMLNTDSINFKDAVFATEEAYLDGELDQILLNQSIKFYVELCRGLIKSGDINYLEKDKINTLNQCAIFTFMTVYNN